MVRPRWSTSLFRRFLKFLITTLRKRPEQSCVGHGATSTSCRKSSRFPYSVHGSTSDRAASNMKYERSEFRDCNETSNRLHLPCDVHRLSTVMGNEFSMIPRLVSSVIGFGVSQRSGGSMELFRECVTLGLQQRFLGLSPHQRPHDTLV